MISSMNRYNLNALLTMSTSLWNVPSIISNALAYHESGQTVLFKSFHGENHSLVLPRPSSARLWPGLVAGAEFVAPELLRSQLRAASRLADTIFGIMSALLSPSSLSLAASGKWPSDLVILMNL